MGYPVVKTFLRVGLLIRHSLAYLEMRVILSKLVYNFNVEICPGNGNWIDQRSYFVWDKPALMIRLTDRFAE